MPDIVPVLAGQSAPLDPTASGFAHGFGLFETLRLADGALYFWEAHWARLTASAEHFGLPVPRAEAVLTALQKLVQADGLSDAIVKLSLLKEGASSRLYLYSRPSLPAPEAVTLHLDTKQPLYASAPLAGHKTHNYMESMYLLGQARQQGHYDLLRLDSDGHLAETTTSNLFFVINGQIHTPARSTGVLPGVTRGALLADSELKVVEGCYQPQVLADAELVFISNATHGLQAVEQISGLGAAPLQMAPATGVFELIARRYDQLAQASTKALQ